MVRRVTGLAAGAASLTVALCLVGSVLVSNEGAGAGVSLLQAVFNRGAVEVVPVHPVEDSIRNRWRMVRQQRVRSLPAENYVLTSTCRAVFYLVGRCGCLARWLRAQEVLHS